jgi:ribosomal RNA-processing protein 1
MATKPQHTEELPSLKDLASSDSRLRRLAFQQIFTNISSRTTPLTYAQCLQLWRGLFVALYMHDSKSMISVQNLTTSLADQFAVIAGRDAEEGTSTDGGPSQLGVFSEAFWETMAREWSGIDVHRMNKILLLIRLVTRSLFKICLPLAEDEDGTGGRPASIRDTDEQCAIMERWPLSLRERKVPDGLRYHVLDIWVEELEVAGGQTNVELHEKYKSIEQKFMEPVKKLAKGGLTKPVRTRAKETLAAAEEMFDYGDSEVDET